MQNWVAWNAVVRLLLVAVQRMLTRSGLNFLYLALEGTRESLQFFVTPLLK